MLLKQDQKNVNKAFTAKVLLMKQNQKNNKMKVNKVLLLKFC